MRADAATPELVRSVAERMRTRDVEELLALSYATDAAELVEGLVPRFGNSPSAIVGSLNDVPVAVFGVFQLRPNVGTLAMFATDDMPRIGLALTRFVRRVLLPQYVTEGTHRFEAVALATHTETHRWIETLGLEPEVLLPMYGKDQQDFLQLAWTAK